MEKDEQQYGGVGAPAGIQTYAMVGQVEKKPTSLWSGCFGIRGGQGGGQLLIGNGDGFGEHRVEGNDLDGEDAVQQQQKGRVGGHHRRVSSLTRWFSSLGQDLGGKNANDRENLQSSHDLWIGDEDLGMDFHGDRYLAKLADDLLETEENGNGREPGSSTVGVKEDEDMCQKEENNDILGQRESDFVAKQASADVQESKYTFAEDGNSGCSNGDAKNSVWCEDQKGKTGRDTDTAKELITDRKRQPVGFQNDESGNANDKQSSDSGSIGESPRYCLHGLDGYSDRETSIDRSSIGSFPDTLGRLSGSSCQSIVTTDQQKAYRRFWKSFTKKRDQTQEKKNPKNEFDIGKTKQVLMSLKSKEDIQSSVELQDALRQMDSRALAAMLKDVAKAGSMNQSRDLFDYIRSLPPEDPISGLADIYTYTTVISQCGAHQMLRKALELVSEMRNKGIRCNIHTYSALMGVCVKSNDCALALEVYEQILQDDCQPNLVTYNILIDAYNRLGKLNDALRTLDEIKSKKMLPEARTYNSIISACSKSCKGELALQIYEKMIHDGVMPTSTTYTSAISACGRAGLVDKAMGLYKSMASTGCRPNVITFSSLITVCERSARDDLAVKLFNDMLSMGVAPNVVTYNGLLGTHAKCCNWRHALAVFDEMISKGCTPDGTTYSALISVLSRCKKWKESLEFVEKAQSLGLRIEPGAYMSMLGCLWASGRMTAQRKALRLLGTAQRNGSVKLHINSQAESTCTADTASSCCLVLIKWLSEFRLGLVGASSYHQPLRVLNFLNGKFCPVDNSYEQIEDHLNYAIRSYCIPAQVYSTSKGLSVEADARILPTWASAGSGHLLLSVLDLENGPAQSGPSMLKEDSILYSQCQKAFGAVKKFEENETMFTTDSFTNLLNCAALRSNIIEHIITIAASLQLGEEISHDAVQLCDRLLALGIPTRQPPPLACAAGLLLLACRQANCAHMVLKNGQIVLQSIGLPISAVLEAENWMMGTLGPSPSAISPLRVLNLYLERLGYDVNSFQRVHLFSVLVATASDLVARAAIDSTFAGFPPSVTAAVCLSSACFKMGIGIFGPIAIHDMTGFSRHEVIYNECSDKMQSLLNPSRIFSI